MNIDARARRAASDLHAAVVSRPPVAPHHRAPRLPRRRDPLRYVLVLGLLVIGIVTARGAIDRPTPSKVTSTPEKLPLLLPTWLPEGVRAASIGDPRQEPDDRPTGDAWYLGTDAGPRMVLQRTPAPGRFSPDDRGATRVADAPASYVTSAIGGRPTRAVLWNKDGALLALTTFDATRDELESAAAAIHQATTPLEDATLPNSMRILEHDPGARWLQGGTGGSGRTVGWTVPAGRGEFVSVDVHRVAAERRMALIFWGGATTTVRDHEAWFVPQIDGEPMQVLTWLEAPGIAVTVSSNFLDATTVELVASSLVTVSLDDWEQVADEVRQGSDPPMLRGADFDVLLAGRTPGGTTWEIARRRVTPRLYCLLLDHRGDTFTGSVTCSGRTGTRTVFADRTNGTTGRSGESIQLVYGMVDPDVARVVVETTDDTIEALLGEPSDGQRPFAAPVVLSTVRVRTFDASGRELGDVPSVEPR